MPLSKMEWRKPRVKKKNLMTLEQCDDKYIYTKNYSGKDSEGQGNRLVCGELLHFKIYA